jgi:ATP-dependent Zn protease
MLSSVEAAVYHEAGHYVVAREMGFDPVVSHTDGMGNGRTCYASPERDRHTYDGRRKLLSVLFAGLLAEHMQFGMWPNERGHTGDHRAATEVALTIPREIRRRVEAEQMQAAARTLREHWSLVEGIAERLRGGGRFGYAS